MKNEKQLKEYLNGLDKEALEELAFICIDRLIEIKEVKFYPYEEDLPTAPYWGASGETLIEHDEY